MISDHRLASLLDQWLSQNLHPKRIAHFQEDRDGRGHQQGLGGRQERHVPARGTADAALAAGAIGKRERES